MPSSMLLERNSHTPSSLLSTFSILNSTISKSTHVPAHFEMFVRNTVEPPNTPPLHIFTALRESNAKLADIQMNDTPQLLQRLPQLESVDPTGIHNTQIILAESTLTLMSGSLPRTAELGIQFELQSFCDLEQYEEFKCSARFFEAGKPVDKVMESPIDFDHKYKRLGNVQFGSRFWAVKVIEIARCLREAQEYRKKAQNSESGQDADAAEDAARNIEFDIHSHFLQLSALQEITAKQRGTGRNVTLLLICWKFEQAGDSRGETTWRNVNLLPSQYQLAKEESQQAKDEFDQLALSLSQHDPTMALQSPFEAHDGFDLDDLSSIGLTGMSTEPTSAAQMYSANDVDFTSGHIHMCLAPDISMGTSATMDPFPDAAVNANSQSLYEDPQHWDQQPSYSSNYFDQNNDYHALRPYDELSVAHLGHHATTPFDGSQGHAGTPFDGHNGNGGVDGTVSLHQDIDGVFNTDPDALGGGSAEQAFPSIELGFGLS
jgi:hypothetical protein